MRTQRIWGSIFSFSQRVLNPGFLDSIRYQLKCHILLPSLIYLPNDVLVNVYSQISEGNMYACIYAHMFIINFTDIKDVFHII